MTATDVLRRLLDERGVEYEGGERSLRWRDRNGVMMQAFPLANGELGLDVWSCTPEQAIAATLGSCNCPNNCTNGERTETCRNAAPSYLDFLCSECGFVHYHSDTNDTGDGNEWCFCPNCGAKIVDPATNDVDAEVDA